MIIVLEMIYRFNAITVKISMTFTKLEKKKKSTIYMKAQIPQIAKEILRKRAILEVSQ
jgi:hypothetical protein